MKKIILFSSIILFFFSAATFGTQFHCPKPISGLFTVKNFGEGNHVYAEMQGNDGVQVDLGSLDGKLSDNENKVTSVKFISANGYAGTDYFTMCDYSMTFNNRPSTTTEIDLADDPQAGNTKFYGPIYVPALKTGGPWTQSGGLLQCTVSPGSCPLSSLPPSTTNKG